MKNNYKFWTVLSLIFVFAAGVVSGVLLDKHVCLTHCLSDHGDTTSFVTPSPGDTFARAAALTPSRTTAVWLRQ